MNTLLYHVINGNPIPEDSIEETLYDICENVHARCNNNCPVFEKFGEAPGNKKPFEVNRGCDCFKNGKKMLKLLRSK